MTIGWTIPAATLARQREASDPANSAWVRANAGSGKTHVLAHRVIRLLMNGVDPSRILCLTFTKAAAANMSMRVFSILSKWTAMDDQALSNTLREMGVSGAVGMDHARQLFASAVETPGGLKIQTIHAFCERILHLFPFEANVPAKFEALDDERQSLLMAEARSAMLQAAGAAPASQLAHALERVAAEASGMEFEALLEEATRKRSLLRETIIHHGDRFHCHLAAEIGVSPGETTETIESEILQRGIPASRWEEILSTLNASTSMDRNLAQRFLKAKAETDPAGKIEAYLDVFLTKDDYKIRGGQTPKLVTNAIRADVRDDLEREAKRLERLVEKRRSTQTLERSAALLIVCDEVLNIYSRLKHARGYLDFEDLIERANALLSRSEAAWVLYKLDAGIDHILVDEAQDTSPQQWKILNALADEFFAGAGARAAHRTFFAVGDEKQSIFSFQGAQPKEFGSNAKTFGERIRNAQREFADVELKTSFRSSPVILSAVDEVFSAPENFAGLSASDAVRPVHEVIKTSLPGLVEIWDPIGPQPYAEPEGWLMPVDEVSEHAPENVLARRIAQKIAMLLHPDSLEAVHDDRGRQRPVRAGDIMVLVRRRNALFESVIRALKVAGVAVAGADRLKLIDHIAVMDLVAAGRAALLPQDDFTLACVLKSPLFGFDDDDLLALAPNRPSTLLGQLRDARNPVYAAAYERIISWGEYARLLGPFRFYAEILNAQGGRQRMLARLGAEAGDAIDEFLRLALHLEKSEPASLTGFLRRMEHADIEIKRDLETAGDSVRVMTIHASKGLESKIVFLPDTCATSATGRFDPKIVEIGRDKLPVWKRGRRDDPIAVQQAIATFRQDQGAEYRRLLYVAMTRAEERLYIAGHHGANGPAEGSWHRMIEATIRRQAKPFLAPWGEGHVWRLGEPALLAAPQAAAAAAQRGELPDWLRRPARREPLPPAPIRPSSALAAADQYESTGDDPTGDDPPADERSLALLAGMLCHALLQYLPDIAPTRRAEAAERYLTRQGRALPEARRRDIARQVLAVLSDPRLACLFGPDSQAEVAVAGRISRPGGGEIEISGRIDRLGRAGDTILIADFKTADAPASETTPRTYLAQMALYRAALAPLFPGQRIRPLIVWTGGPTIVELDHGALDRALAESLT